MPKRLGLITGAWFKVYSLLIGDYYDSLANATSPMSDLITAQRLRFRVIARDKILRLRSLIPTDSHELFNLRWGRKGIEPPSPNARDCRSSHYFSDRSVYTRLPSAQSAFNATIVRIACEFKPRFKHGRATTLDTK